MWKISFFLGCIRQLILGHDLHQNDATKNIVMCLMWHFAHVWREYSVVTVWHSVLVHCGFCQVNVSDLKSILPNYFKVDLVSSIGHVLHTFNVFGNMGQY